MGVKHYGVEIDMWSVGCILLELLTRRIAFQANSLPQQLRMMTTLVGSPNEQDLVGCDGAMEFVLSQPQTDGKLMNVLKNASCSERNDISAHHLVKNLLMWNPRERFSTHEALMSRFISDGRLRFHSCMCSCCTTINGKRNFCSDLEPIPRQIFNDSYESNLPNLTFAKGNFATI